MGKIRTGVVLVVGGALGLALSVPAVAGQDPPASQSPGVTASAQVTRNPLPTRAHSSPQLARNPVTGELAIVEAEVRHDFGCAVHISTDDGRSWARGGQLQEEPYTHCARDALNGPYASLAYGSDGVLYVAYMGSDPATAMADVNPIGIFLARSDDSGRSFRTTAVLEPTEDTPRNARPMLAVDPGNSERVYVSWMQRPAEGKSLALVAASTDGGRSFAEPVDLSLEQGGYQPRLAVGPDGTVHAVFPASSFHPELSFDEVVRPLMYARSSDQGETWTEAVAIDPGNTSFFAMRKAMIAADQNDGRIYVVWYGNEKETIDPKVDDVDIFVRTSSDGGDTWSERVTVNDDAAEDRHINHYDPGISIAPNGRVDVAWYDFRNSPYPERFPDGFTPPFNHDGFQDVYYSYSTDGGATWADNVRITDRIINREVGVWSNNIHSHMSVGIASSDDSVYFAWQDTRNGTGADEAEDVYFASARHAPIGAGAGTSVVSAAAVGGSGFALGMGLAMVIAWAVARRRTGEPAEEADLARV